MKHLILIAASLLAIAPLASAQTAVLYQQDWGTGSGTTLPLTQVGWSQVHAPSGWDGIYPEPTAHDGETSASLPTNTLYFGASAASAGIFYTTNGAGSGSSGNSAFTSINPTLHTNLNIALWCQWSWQGQYLTSWFAVQVGGAWYVCTNRPLTTAQASASPIFYRSSITYNPAATNWNTLTFTGSSVAVGGLAGADLSGNIAGVGVVVLQSDAGSWNYNNFLITSISNPPTAIPALNAPPISQTAYTGAGVAFSVSGTGTPPPKYYWQKDGVTLTNGGRFSGATNATLTILNVSSADVGNYSVIVSNSVGYFDTSTNTTASLTVSDAPVDYLYAETFPFVGALPVGYPVSVVGWSNAIADNLNRLFQTAGGDGAFYAYEGAASTKAFYVTTNSDAGASGLKFAKVTPASFPAVSFSVDVAPSYQPANVTAHFAVQMNGGSWYVGSTPISVNTSVATETFATYAQQFDPLAANWNALTLTATSATVGSAAVSNLTGDITGAGLVFVYTGGGTFNIDNFLVTTNAVAPTPPTITFSPYSQTAYTGAGVSFAVAASGTQPFTYFWQKGASTLANGGNISGATSNRLTILSVTTNEDQVQYSAIVSNTAGTDSTANYITTLLTVTDPPSGLLYSESFPYVGPGTAGFPVSAVGWGNAIPNNPDRLFQVAGGDGAVYAYQGAAATTAFFASTSLDPGASGLLFPSINLGFYPSLTFSVDIAPSSSSSNVTVALAVQMNGGAWYVSATNLPVDTSIDNPAYSIFTQSFTPVAAFWKNLTLTAGSGATIGAAAGGNLTGSITGAGLVFTHTGTGGTFNFDNFQIAGTGIGGVTVGAVTSSAISLSWIGQPGVYLQSATNLNSPVFWTAVPNTTGKSAATVNQTGPQMFFRLAQPQP